MRLLSPVPPFARLRLGALGLALMLGACGGHAPTWPAAATPAQPSLPATSVAVDTDLSPVAVAADAPVPPEGWEHGVFMEIFVRGYQDSDGDGIGDLKGLVSRLDYLQQLGIRGLWLMPVTPSADRDHGYATTDYRGIERQYGTLADFDLLLREAGRRGIGVIIDYVINHSAAEHPLFVASRTDRASRFRDWYVWADVAPRRWDIWGKNPWYAAGASQGHYFGTFGPHMPDFNLRHPDVLEYHRSSLRWWLNRGLGGFRLDAVPHMIENDAVRWNDQPESRRLARELQDLVKAYPRRVVVCEATAEPRAWGDPEVCGGAFAFGYVHHFVEAARGNAESVAQLASYYASTPATMATFVSNHDSFAGRRLWDQLQGDEVRYRLAAAAYLLQPGTPYVYYGEEIGQAGAGTLQGDPQLRGPMSWSAEPRGAGFTTGAPFRPLATNAATHNVQAQLADPGSLLNFYRAVIGLRNARASIARGSFEGAFSQGLVMGYQRRWGDERTLVVFNYGTAPARVAAAGLPAGAPLRALYPQALAAPPVAADVDGRVEVALAPQSFAVFDVGR